MKFTTVRGEWQVTHMTWNECEGFYSGKVQINLNEAGKWEGTVTTIHQLRVERSSHTDCHILFCCKCSRTYPHSFLVVMVYVGLLPLEYMFFLGTFELKGQQYTLHTIHPASFNFEPHSCNPDLLGKGRPHICKVDFRGREMWLWLQCNLTKCQCPRKSWFSVGSVDFYRVPLLNYGTEHTESFILDLTFEDLEYVSLWGIVWPGNPREAWVHDGYDRVELEVLKGFLWSKYTHRK